MLQPARDYAAMDPVDRVDHVVHAVHMVHQVHNYLYYENYRNKNLHLLRSPSYYCTTHFVVSMSKPAHKAAPTPTELTVLQELWARGPLSVKDVHAALEVEKPVVYTTVLKIMQIMHDRGLLTRVAQGRKHIYTAAVERDATQDTLLDTFLDKAFGGSAKTLVMRALGKHTPSPDEIDELRAFLNDLDTDTDKSR